VIRLLVLPEQDQLEVTKRVYARLRDWNIREVIAAFGDSEYPLLDGLAFHASVSAIKRYVFLDEDPIALAGCIPLASGGGRLYFLGTDAVEDHGARIAVLIRKFLPVAAKAYGITRLESSSLAGNPKSARWFEVLGGMFVRNEQDHNGMDYEVYEWSFS
jgi:hypothetical protein